MKNVLLALATSSLLLSGCAAMVASPVNGHFYTDVKGPINVGSGINPSKTGKACASSLFGMVATGDASIDAAKKNGGIREVSSIDHQSKNILGIHTEFCTIVNGS